MQGVAAFLGMVVRDLMEEITLGTEVQMMRPSQPWLNLGKSVPCRRHSKCRGPAELDMKLMYLRHRKKIMVATAE